VSPALRVPTTANAPAITVVIPTRDRGDSILLPIRTLLENDYDRFEVRIVDQSESNATATSVAPFLVDPRVLIGVAIVYAIFIAYFAFYSRHHLVAAAPGEEAHI